MAIGERIYFFRKLRNMSRKWLGTKVGFHESTADVRLAQYESGTRTPKGELTKALAGLLDVSPLALSVPDIDSHLGLIHTLFALEDRYGLKAELTGNGLRLRFDEKADASEFYDMVYAWAEQSTKLKSGEITKAEYDEWRYHYPEFDTTIRHTRVPSQELSDLITETLDLNL